MNVLDKNVGIIFNFQNGYLMEHPQVGQIQPEFAPCIEFVRRKVGTADLGVTSVYVTGAIAKGTAVKGVSDLDLAFIFKDLNFDKIKLYKHWNELIRVVPEFGPTHLDCKYLTIDEIMSSGPLKLIFRYQGLCVFGDAFSSRISHLPMSSCFMFRDVFLEQLSDFRANKQNQFSEEILRKYCRSIMKMILRASMELIMEKEQKYTDDLYPCFNFFCKHYPSEEQIMYSIMELALNPTADKNVIFGKVAWAENFFADKFARVLI